MRSGTASAAPTAANARHAWIGPYESGSCWSPSDQSRARRSSSPVSAGVIPIEA
jgi:hypothetical protein